MNKNAQKTKTSGHFSAINILFGEVVLNIFKKFFILL